MKEFGDTSRRKRVLKQQTKRTDGLEIPPSAPYKPDEFDQNEENPNFDQFTMETMFSKHSEYLKEKEKAYQDFVFATMSSLPRDIDFESDSDLQIIKTQQGTTVDLSSFDIEIQKDQGMDMMKHVFDNNLNQDKAELVYQMKHNKSAPIKYEKLSNSLLHLLNDITNDDVKFFH